MNSITNYIYKYLFTNNNHHYQQNKYTDLSSFYFQIEWDWQIADGGTTLRVVKG